MLQNGLYAVEIRTLDGVDGLATGVVIMRDGVLLGGDPYFYYTGTYTCKDGRIKGELVNHQHTPHLGDIRILYAGYESGVGFSGTYQDDRAEMHGISNVGRRSVSIQINSRKVADE